MFGNPLRVMIALKGKPIGSGGDEGRIFHASSFISPMWRIDHCNLRIGIGSVPLIEALHRTLHNVQVALPRTLVAGVTKQPNSHGPYATVELAFNHLEVWIGGPGKIVDVFSVEGDGFGSISVVAVAGLYAGCTDDVVLGRRDPDVIGAEVGEEFRHGMKLMAVPCAVPPHPDLGKPLSGQQEACVCSLCGLRLRGTSHET